MAFTNPFVRLPAFSRPKDAPRWMWVALLGLLAVQIAYVRASSALRPGITEMPVPPSTATVKAMALGDDEFLYRYLAYWLQGVGDGGGRVRPLREYDYDRVIAWMKTIDRLDERANYVHELAARYFGAERIDPARLRKIVFYLRDVGVRDPQRRWPYMVWAADTARDALHDKALSHALAADFGATVLQKPGIPAWVRELGARLYSYSGDQKAAAAADAAISQADHEEIRRDLAGLLARQQAGQREAERRAQENPGK